MSSDRPAGGRGPSFPGRYGRPDGRGQMRLLFAIVALATVGLVVYGLSRGRHAAEFAPLSVIDSREPLQELPIRAAQGDEAVEPAHTYDAILDLSNLERLVVGVDLDYVPKGFQRYDAVIRNSEGGRLFRAQIHDEYFKEGRMMLRLFAKGLKAGDYTLDIEGFGEGDNDGRIIASSWFQVSR